MTFWDTVAGHRFAEHTVPSLIKAMNRLTDAMEKANHREEQKKAGRIKFLEEMLNHVFQFAQEEDLSAEIAMEQLRSLWTGFCICADYHVDTGSYDNDLMRLWDRVSGNSTNPFANYEAFDAFMCEQMV